MSDTITAAEPAPILNYSATPKTELVNGVAEQWMVVKYGQNAVDKALPDRVLEIRKIDAGDQFDLAEIAGANVDNEVWLSLAIVALSVQRMDGVPVARGNLTKTSLRATLKSIGPIGIRAVRRAVYEMAGVGGEEKPAAELEKAVAGN